MVIVFGRQQMRPPAIFTDGFPVNASLPVDLPLADSLVYQCFYGRFQMRLQNVHPSSLPFVNSTNGEGLYVLSPFSTISIMKSVRLGGGFSSGHRWGILGGHQGFNSFC